MVQKILKYYIMAPALQVPGALSNGVGAGTGHTVSLSEGASKMQMLAIFFSSLAVFLSPSFFFF